MSSSTPIPIWTGSKADPTVSNVKRTESRKRSAEEIVCLAHDLVKHRSQEKRARGSLNPVVRTVRSTEDMLIQSMVSHGRECLIMGDTVITIRKESAMSPTTPEIRANLLGIDGLDENKVQQIMNVLKKTARHMYRVEVSGCDDSDGDNNDENGNDGR